MKIAIFGLGRMGMQIAKRLQVSGFDVLAWNRSEEARSEFKSFGGKVFEEVGEVVSAFGSEPKVYWVMLPSENVESFIFETLLPGLKPGDIVIDGGNSFYKDSARRGVELASRGVIFYDCGTSGGVWGLKRGFAIMVGGPKEHWDKVKSIFSALSSGDNFELLGNFGAGHFVKMIHNGIEYGMMEAIGEGYAVLKASEFDLNLKDVTRVYQKGSVISSWLIDLTRDIFENEDVSKVSGKIDSTGEGEWTIKTAREMGVDVRVIEDAYKVRQESALEENKEKFSNKIVALLRKQFGGHKVH